MGTIILLYDPKSDSAVLSGGSWRATLPLTNLADRRLSRVARSTDAELASTQFRVTLNQEETFQTLVLGPMNVTSAYQYRIRSYATQSFDTIEADSGWVKPFTGSAGDPLALEWEDPNFWLGIEPFEDDERGVYLIHRFDAPVSSQWWSFEIDDQFNPDGYVQAGRLFMAETWRPSRNYVYGPNLSFRDNSLSSQTLGGSVDRWRRLNPRVFRFGFDYLPDAEVFAAAYDMMRTAGYDREVFVVPDPDDPTTIQQRSMLGTLTQMDGLSQAALGVSAAGFEITEAI